MTDSNRVLNSSYLTDCDGENPDIKRGDTPFDFFDRNTGYDKPDDKAVSEPDSPAYSPDKDYSPKYSPQPYLFDADMVDSPQLNSEAVVRGSTTAAGAQPSERKRYRMVIHPKPSSSGSSENGTVSVADSSSSMFNQQAPPLNDFSLSSPYVKTVSFVPASNVQSAHPSTLQFLQGQQPGGNQNVASVSGKTKSFKHKPCFDLAGGFPCKRGDTCYFSHDPAVIAKFKLGEKRLKLKPEPVSGGSDSDSHVYKHAKTSKLCSNYLKGCCKYGASCNFKHSELLSATGQPKNPNVNARMSIPDKVVLKTKRSNLVQIYASMLNLNTEDVILKGNAVHPISEGLRSMVKSMVFDSIFKGIHANDQHYAEIARITSTAVKPFVHFVNPVLGASDFFRDIPVEQKQCVHTLPGCLCIRHYPVILGFDVIYYFGWHGLFEQMNEQTFIGSCHSFPDNYSNPEYLTEWDVQVQGDNVTMVELGKEIDQATVYQHANVKVPCNDCMLRYPTKNGAGSNALAFQIILRVGHFYLFRVKDVVVEDAETYEKPIYYTSVDSNVLKKKQIIRKTLDVMSDPGSVVAEASWNKLSRTMNSYDLPAVEIDNTMVGDFLFQAKLRRINARLLNHQANLRMIKHYLYDVVSVKCLLYVLILMIFLNVFGVFGFLRDMLTVLQGIASFSFVFDKVFALTNSVLTRLAIGSLANTPIGFVAGNVALMLNGYMAYSFVSRYNWFESVCLHKLDSQQIGLLLSQIILVTNVALFYLIGDENFYNAIDVLFRVPLFEEFIMSTPAGFLNWSLLELGTKFLVLERLDLCTVVALTYFCVVRFFNRSPNYFVRFSFHCLANFVAILLSFSVGEG
jgi:hypothetical protein